VLSIIVQSIKTQIGFVLLSELLMKDVVSQSQESASLAKRGA
jgi:hypothetical protein